MGIVAYCPNGHRVKVKDELAGRKGICPECQARFRIPRDAPWPAGGKASRAAVGGHPVARVVSLDPSVAARLPRAFKHNVRHDAAHKQSAEPPSAGGEPMASTAADPPRRPASLHAALAERPDLTWSVSVPGGQASEPMSAEAMQRWLDAGSLTGGELVWREGWADWVSIRLVFPECMPASRG